MATENEYEEVDVNTQEEITSEEVNDTQEETQEDDSLTLSGEEKAEFEKWKAKKEERQKFVEKAKSNPQPQKASYNVTADKLERMELQLDGYSKDEVEAIMDLGGTRALGNPLVKGAIESMRSKTKSNESNQSLNSKSPVFKKFTQDDLSKMSSAELAKILPR